MRSFLTAVGAVAALLVGATAASFEATSDANQVSTNLFHKAASDLNTDPNVSTKGWAIPVNVCAGFPNTGSLGLKGGWRTAPGWTCNVYAAKNCVEPHLVAINKQWSGNPTGLFSARCFEDSSVKVADVVNAGDSYVLVADETSTTSATYTTTFSATITRTYTKDGQPTTVTFRYVDDDPCRDCPDPTTASTGSGADVAAASIPPQGLTHTFTMDGRTTTIFFPGPGVPAATLVSSRPAPSGPAPSGPVSFGQYSNAWETHFSHHHAPTSTASLHTVTGGASYSVSYFSVLPHTGGEPQLSLPPAVQASLLSLRSTAVPEPYEPTITGTIHASTVNVSSVWSLVWPTTTTTATADADFHAVFHKPSFHTYSSVNTSTSLILITPAPSVPTPSVPGSGSIFGCSAPLATDSNGVITGFPSCSEGPEAVRVLQTDVPAKRQAQSYEYCQAQCEESFAVCQEQYGYNYRPACECKVYAPGTYCRTHCSGGHKPELYNAACAGDSQAKTAAGGILFDGGAPPKRAVETGIPSLTKRKEDIKFLISRPEDNGTITEHDCFPACLASLGACYNHDDQESCLDGLFGEGSVCTMSCPNAISVLVQWGHTLNRALNLTGGKTSQLSVPGTGFTQTLLSATGKDFVTVTTTGSVMPSLAMRDNTIEGRAATDFTLCTGMIADCMSRMAGVGVEQVHAVEACRSELDRAGCPTDGIDPTWAPPHPRLPKVTPTCYKKGHRGSLCGN